MVIKVVNQHNVIMSTTTKTLCAWANPDTNANHVKTVHME